MRLHASNKILKTNMVKMLEIVHHSVAIQYELIGKGTLWCPGWPIIPIFEDFQTLHKKREATEIRKTLSHAALKKEWKMFCRP